MMRLVVLVLLLLTAGAGCGVPRDSGTTLDDVRGGVLRVGVTANRPWAAVADDGTVDGAEVTLVERLADELDATVEWYPGSESELMAALRHRVLDVVVGGLTDDAPWIKEASLTRPYITTRTVVAARPGVAVPDDLSGTRIAARAGSGVKTTRAAVANLMDNRPRVVDGSAPHPLPDQILAAVRDLDWVADAWLRIREEGLVFAGELLVVPASDVTGLVPKLEDLGEWVRSMDWRMHDLVVAPVTRIERP